MTCHVVMRGTDGTVVLADSQGSDDISEAHGFQKLLAGDGWIVGGAGSGEILFAIFDQMVIDQASLTRETIAEYIVRFIDNSVTHEARRDVHLYAATDTVILDFKPRVFRNMRDHGSFLTIGSGAEFVNRAHARDHDLGIAKTHLTLADTFINAEAALNVANESLTVDDRLLMGLIVNGSTYMIGNREVHASYAPRVIADNWNMGAQKFEAIRAIADAHRGELQNAQRELSAIAIGAVTQREIEAILASNATIAGLRQDLQKALVELIEWYDGLLGRNPSSTP